VRHVIDALHQYTLQQDRTQDDNAANANGNDIAGAAVIIIDPTATFSPFADESRSGIPIHW